MSLFVGAFGFLFARLSLDKMVELGNDPKLLQEPPHFGWLSNSIDGYPYAQFEDEGTQPRHQATATPIDLAH